MFKKTSLLPRTSKGNFYIGVA